jgi:uncharacterized protein Yka (UPF0111/DUF47 family)
MTLLPGRSVDDGLLALIEESGVNARRACVLLRDLLSDYPEQTALAGEILRCEHEGDRITHDVIHWVGGGRRMRAPFDAGDGYALATALDDIVDHAEEVADTLGIYAVEASMEAAVEMAEVLVGAAEQVARALRSLRNGSEPASHLEEIHRLENDGDRIRRDAVAALFASGVDPMVVIRWRDIFESLEAAVDSCESVAHLLEGIALKRRRRRRQRVLG